MLLASSAATSGDYERFFEQDSKRCCHVLDPRGGELVGYWQSVSAMAPRAVAAGACATIAMLKQAERLEFLRQIGESLQNSECINIRINRASSHRTDPSFAGRTSTNLPVERNYGIDQ